MEEYKYRKTPLEHIRDAMDILASLAHVAFMAALFFIALKIYNTIVPSLNSAVEQMKI